MLWYLMHIAINVVFLCSYQKLLRTLATLEAQKMQAIKVLYTHVIIERWLMSVIMPGLGDSSMGPD